MKSQYVSKQLGTKQAGPRAGFTIVELLIVVVVIAILAAITIVSYNGISRSAHDSGLQNNLSQASRKLEIFRIESKNGIYPSNIGAAGFLPTGSEGQDYVYAVSTDGGRYCLAINGAGRTYFVDSTRTTPHPGICTGTTGVAGTGDVASDGESSATGYKSIFGDQAPGTSQVIGDDGGGSLRIGNRFYTTQSNGIKVVGLRVYNPASSSAAFLAQSVMAYAYVDDWRGSNLMGSATFGKSPVMTKAFSGTRTAGSWTDIVFDTSITLPKVTGGSGPADMLTLAVQYSGGREYLVVQPMSSVNTEIQSSMFNGVYLSESNSLGRGVNTVSSGVTDTYYGIDILFEPITP